MTVLVTKVLGFKNYRHIKMKTKVCGIRFSNWGWIPR